MYEQSLSLAKQLIVQQSISPADHSCQNIIGNLLTKAGFNVTTKLMGDTTNTFASFDRSEGPCLALAGHTDIVPPGRKELWHHNPFSGEIVDGELWGRGTIDMKVALACMITAGMHYVSNNPDLQGRLVYLITSDEEIGEINGMQKLLEEYQSQIQQLDACLIGEPTSEHQLGDTYKFGRRGSINGILKISGKQGHIAYPEFALNPIRLAGKFINSINEIKWDQENTSPFPNTHLEFSSLTTDNIAINVIPEFAELQFNFRYAPNTNPESIKNRILELLAKLNISGELTTWRVTSGGPYLSQTSKLSKSLTKSISKNTSLSPKASVDGGTSDGRYIAKICPEVIEFGPSRALAHQINERIALDDIKKLVQIYYQTIENFFSCE